MNTTEVQTALVRIGWPIRTEKQTKMCRSCNAWFPAEEITFHGPGRFYCRTCDLIPADKRRCNACTEVLPLEAFAKRGDGQGLRGMCKECRRVKDRERWLNPKRKASQRAYTERYQTKIGPDEWRRQRRDAMLRSNYGVSLTDYEYLLEQQQGRCAICRKLPAVEVLAVDHRHDDGTVRGLLCRPCNSGLGFFQDDPGIVRAALTYIERDRVQEATNEHR